jgi:hypothetical protein
MRGSGIAVHYLLEHTPVQRELKSREEVVCFHYTSQLVCEDSHADGQVFDLQLKPTERALITAINLVYCRNHTGREIRMCLRLPHSKDDTDTLHPDLSGNVYFVVPASGANGTVPKRDMMLYEPNFFNLGFDLIPFLGMEHSILNARSSAILSSEEYQQRPAVDFELFLLSDPFLAFMLREKAKLKFIGQNDILVLPDKKHYKVSKTVVERMRGFFAEKVFPLFLYVETNHLCLTWPQTVSEPVDDGAEQRRNGGFGIIVLRFTIDYYVVEATKVPKYTGYSVKELRL